jgi:hypothetical protein
MGEMMREDDVYIESMFDLLNLRFCPTPRPRASEWLGGIEEMAALQKQFEIFQRDRSFRDSIALLNAGGFWNSRAKKRWYDLLSTLGELPSNQRGQTGNDAIVNALITNLGSPNPLPVYFTAHDSRLDDRVVVRDRDRPLFYLEQDYLTISLPLRPRRRRGVQRRQTRQ